jgi:hypothetical protein
MPETYPADSLRRKPQETAMEESKNTGKFTQNYPTERKDYEKKHSEPGLKDVPPVEGDEASVDEALARRGVAEDKAA